MEGTCGLSRMAMCERHRCLATSLVSRRRCTALRFLPHVAALLSLQRPLPAVTKGLDALPCLPDTRGALQPAASRAMQMQATRAFHTTLPDKIILPFIIVLIVMPPVYLCRRTPFMMISSLHVTKVMMLIMIMTTRPEIRDQRPETRDRRPETRDPRLETRD